jgi:tetratricopeptide (TPR) repeat protein
MRWASAPWIAAGGLVAAVFVARAAIGVPSARAYHQGARLAASGDVAAAIPLLGAGELGANRSEALWLSGEARLGVWDASPEQERHGSPGDRTLRAATASFLKGRSAAPASAWYGAALGQVYARRESLRRERRTVDLAEIVRGPWALLGDDGRVAVGLVRAAIEQQPTSFEFRDQLVLLLLGNGLRADALEAVGESARVLPDFGAHPGLSFESLPRDVVEQFWNVSRAVTPADAPLMLRERHLLSLGQLGRRLGRLDEAEQDLREALRAPGTDLFHAEDAFHLGLVLIDAGRPDEAEPMLAMAARQPVFAPGVAAVRARLAEAQGRPADALDRLREARLLEPKDLGVLLDFARVAGSIGEWDQAEEALRWADVTHPGDPAPERAMVVLYLAKGDGARARSALDRFRGLVGDTAEVAEFERRLSSSLDQVPR